MRKVKYGDKKLLCRYDLSKNFFDKLGLEILDITPLRKLYILNTTEGKKILKKVNYNEDRIKFIGESLDYVNKNFPYIMKMNKLQANDNYIKWQEDIYIVMDLIEGREASISNPIEVEMCSEALARMHKASQMISDSLEPKGIPIKKSNNLVEYYKSIKEDLINIREWVSGYTYKNEFDKLFLENCDRYIEEISKVNEMIWVSKYRDLLMDKELICLCHNDLANHNFIINENKINIIDFDYSTIDLRTLDIADFLLKWIKNSVFDINKGKLALESYDKIFKIKDEEYKLIYILMSFPRDIYSIIKSYYHKSKEWEEEVFLHRFMTKLENDVFRIRFLDDYKKFYEEKIL